MSGVAIITVSNNVLLIAIWFVLLFGNGDWNQQHRGYTWAGALVGLIAVTVLGLFAFGALAQQVIVPLAATPTVSFIERIVPLATAVGGALLVLVPTVVWAINQIKTALAPVKIAVEAVKAEQTAQGLVIQKLEVNTNSITGKLEKVNEKLLMTTEAGATAKGNLEGRAALQAEKDAEAVAAIKPSADAMPVGATISPTPVEVINEKPVKVTETK